MDGDKAAGRSAYCSCVKPSLSNPRATLIRQIVQTKVKPICTIVTHLQVTQEIRTEKDVSGERSGEFLTEIAA